MSEVTENLERQLDNAYEELRLDYHINGIPRLNLPLGGFIPPIICGTELEKEWLDDIASVAAYDFPQGQIINVAEKGNAEHLFLKSRERMCGQVQLETARGISKVIDQYAESHPEYLDWKLPECHEKYEGRCKKGGCNLGSDLYLERLI